MTTNPHAIAHTHPHPAMYPASATFAQKFIIESAAIEGQAIDLDSALTSMHGRAYELAMEHAADKPLALLSSDIKNWQLLIGSEQEKWGDRRLRTSDLGRYRQHIIYISKSRETGEPKEIGSRYWEIEQHMDALLTIVNETPQPEPGKKGLGPTRILDIAAYIHWTYERIHPFADGNGRSGRLLALWFLKRNKYKPVLFTDNDKVENYYPCFDQPVDLMRTYFREHLVSGW